MRKILLLIFIATILASCSKDEEPVKDLLVSEVTGLSNELRVWGTLSLAFEVTGGVGNPDVLLSVDDIPLTTLTSPYRFELDTRRLLEGERVLRVTASDPEGNESNALEFRLIVSNDFLTVTVEEGYQGFRTDVYLLLTSEDNEILGFTTLADGETYEFERPQNFSDPFYNYTYLKAY